MITHQMIVDGYRKGIVKLVDSPNGDGTVCQIGDNWFYFGGEAAEGVSPEQYRNDVPEDGIIDEIYFTLKYFHEDGGEYLDEYMYYEFFLNESKRQRAHRSGVIRRVDDLGRIVIPKEIRKALKIREGEPVEISLSNDGKSIMLEKVVEDELWELEKCVRDFEGDPGRSVDTEEARKAMLAAIKKYKEARNDK